MAPPSRHGEAGYEAQLEQPGNSTRLLSLKPWL